MPKNKDEDELISMSCCYLHPKQILEGVCPLCLNDKLLGLAANKKGTHHLKIEEQVTTYDNNTFGLGSILNRFELSRGKHDTKKKNVVNHVDIDRSPSPLEDSFISIRFGENGIGSWEKNNPTSSKTMSFDHNVKSRSTMSWQKQICRLFRLAKWKRPDKDLCHMSNTKEGAAKVRNVAFRASV